jgi:AI-2 transport protein TqsA
MIGWKNYKTGVVQEHKEQNWLITISLVILAVVALAGALIYTRTVMIPFVVALFIVALVSPIEDFQVKRLRLPRVIAIIVTLLVVLSVITILSLFVAQAIRTIASTAGEYSSSFAQMANRLLKPVEYLYSQEEAQLPATADRAELAPNEPPSQRLTAQADANAVATPPAEPEGLAKRIQHIDTRQIVKDLTDNARQAVKDMTNHMFNVLKNTVGTLFGLLSGSLFVCVFVIFLLAGRNPYAEHSQMYVEVVQKMRRYLGTKVITSAIVGVLVWASLAIIGLELAGVFGVLAFLVNFIPVIGPIIVTVLPIPLAVAQFQSPWPVILVVVVPGVIHNVIGNIIEPKLMGEGLDLHPVTILLALSFWGLLWGIVGTFLATPITAVMRIVLMQFETFKPIANLLAGDVSKPPAADAEAKSVSARPEEIEPAGSPRA